MAKRVAAQRRGMMYGMIAAIFVATVMTVLFFLQVGKTEEVKKLIVSPGEPDKALSTQDILNKSRTAINDLSTKGILPSDKGVVSLVEGIQAAVKSNEERLAHIDSLTNAIAGTPTLTLQGDALKNRVLDVKATADRAREQATAALYAVPQAGVTAVAAPTDKSQPETLVDAIGLLSRHVDALVLDYKAKLDVITRLQADVASEGTKGKEAVGTLTADYEAIKAKQMADIADKTRLIAEGQAQVEKVRADYEAARKAHNEDLVKDKEELQKKVNEIIQLNDRLKELSDRIGREQLRQFEPDGRIVKIDPGEETGYINLGRVHAVFNGMTFGVWDPREVGKQGKAKGFVRISKVMDASSEFVITKTLTNNNPIVTGDLITNAAFDLERPFHFAVIGRFDVNGDGTEDTDWVKSKIRSFGGKAQDKLTIQTDYLVVGDDPMNSAPKISGAPTPQQEILLGELKKQQQAFGEATDMAQRLHIPVLTVNRFLTLTGIPAEK